MSYIGNKPANKAVVASDLDPAVITGQTALAVAPADTDEFLISDAGTLKRIDASLVGGGGITEADLWRVNTSFTGDANPIASNWERADDDTAGYLGTGMTQSSGIFTFPSTGFWRIAFTHSVYINGDDRSASAYIKISSDSGSSYDSVAESHVFMQVTGSNFTHNHATTNVIIDVTNASTFRARFDVEKQNSSTNTFGHTSRNETFAEFIRLGDT